MHVRYRDLNGGDASDKDGDSGFLGKGVCLIVRSTRLGREGMMDQQSRKLLMSPPRSLLKKSEMEKMVQREVLTALEARPSEASRVKIGVMEVISSWGDFGCPVLRAVVPWRFSVVHLLAVSMSAHAQKGAFRAYAEV